MDFIFKQKSSFSEQFQIKNIHFQTIFAPVALIFALRQENLQKILKKT
jgi:hypothetical protein